MWQSEKPVFEIPLTTHSRDYMKVLGFSKNLFHFLKTKFKGHSFK